MSMNAPIRIATENTVWQMQDLKIDFFFDVGAAYFLPKINQNPSLGSYLALTSHKLKGEEVVRFGVATHYMRQK